MGINYGFDHGTSVLFVYGEDGFDEIGPKILEYFSDPRWHSGKIQMLVSVMGRKYNVLTWEEIKNFLKIPGENRVMPVSYQ